MTYRFHSDLTPRRVAVLVRVARGDRFEIQRLQARWLEVNGYLYRTTPRTEAPRYDLTDQARGLPEVATALAEGRTAAVASGAGYRADSVKRLGEARKGSTR